MDMTEKKMKALPCPWGGLRFKTIGPCCFLTMRMPLPASKNGIIL